MDLAGLATREGRVYEIEGARLLQSRGSWPNWDLKIVGLTY